MKKLKTLFVILIASLFLISCFDGPPDIHVGKALYKTKLDNSVKPAQTFSHYVFVEGKDKTIIRLTVEPEIYDSIQKGDAVQYRVRWCGYTYCSKF
jgi:hypothetical protein